MVLTILATLLVLGIAFYQAVQGLFSALIMALLSILCTAIAFQFYEPAAALLYTRQPAHADALCLLALFVIPLLIVRIAVDKLLSGNVVLGAWPDRIAGGALGVITGMICTGMLLIVIQMLPTGPRWLTYRPFTDTLQRNDTLTPFYPDEFVIGLANAMSGPGAMGEGPSGRFENLHDNLLLEYWAAKNEANQFRIVDNDPYHEHIGRMDTVPGSLAVECYDPNKPAWGDKVPKDPLMGDDPSRLLVVRVKVNESARDLKDHWWRLPATQFRLVSAKKDADGVTHYVSHYPVGFLTGCEATLRTYPTNRVERGAPGNWAPICAVQEKGVEDTRAQVGRLVVQRPWSSDHGPKDLTIDWIYRIGRDEEPKAVFFRRVARQEITIVKNGMPDAKDALDRITAKKNE